MSPVSRCAPLALSLLAIASLIWQPGTSQEIDPFEGGDPFTDPLPPRAPRDGRPREAIKIPAPQPLEKEKEKTRIDLALDGPTTLEFIETPLGDIAKFIGALHKIDVRLDQRGLDDIGIAADTPLTFNVRGVSLRSALRLMLMEFDGGFHVQDGALVITSD
mgnify:CR=1 FL=1